MDAEADSLDEITLNCIRNILQQYLSRLSQIFEIYLYNQWNPEHHDSLLADLQRLYLKTLKESRKLLKPARRVILEQSLTKMESHLERYKREKQSICQCFEDITQARKALVEDKERLNKVVSRVTELEGKVKTAMKEQKRIRKEIEGLFESVELNRIRRIWGQYVVVLIGNNQEEIRLDRAIYPEIVQKLETEQERINFTQQKLGLLNKNKLKKFNHNQFLEKVASDLRNPKSLSLIKSQIESKISQLKSKISSRNPQGPISLKNIQILRDNIEKARSKLAKNWEKVNERLEAMQAQLDAQNRKISLFKVDNYSKYYLDSLAVRKKENIQLLKSIREAVESIEGPIRGDYESGKGVGVVCSSASKISVSQVNKEKESNSKGLKEMLQQPYSKIENREKRARGKSFVKNDKRISFSRVPSFFDESFGQVKLKSLLEIKDKTGSRFKHLKQKLVLPLAQILPQAQETAHFNQNKNNPPSQQVTERLSKSHRGQESGMRFKLDLKAGGMNRMIQTSRYTPNSGAVFPTDRYEFSTDRRFSRRFGDLSSSFRPDQVKESERGGSRVFYGSGNDSRRPRLPPILHHVSSANQTERRHRERMERMSQDLSHNMQLSRDIIQREKKRQAIRPVWGASKISKTFAGDDVESNNKTKGFKNQIIDQNVGITQGSAFSTLGGSKIDNQKPEVGLVKSQIPVSNQDLNRSMPNQTRDMNHLFLADANYLAQRRHKYSVPMSSKNLGRDERDNMRTHRAVQPSSTRSRIAREFCFEKKSHREKNRFNNLNSGNVNYQSFERKNQKLANDEIENSFDEDFSATNPQIEKPKTTQISIGNDSFRSKSASRWEIQKKRKRSFTTDKANQDFPAKNQISHKKSVKKQNTETQLNPNIFVTDEKNIRFSELKNSFAEEFYIESGKKRVFWGVEELLERSPIFFEEVNRKWFYEDPEKTYEKVIQKMYRGLQVGYCLENNPAQSDWPEMKYVSFLILFFKIINLLAFSKSEKNFF